MRGTNSKNNKKRPKNHSFAAVKGWNGVEKLRPSKGISRAPTLMYIPNFNFLSQLGGDLGEEQHFFEVKRGGNSISPLLIGLGDWFLDM